MKKVLVTGSNGFVAGYVIQQLIETGYYVFATSQSDDLLPFRGHPHYHFIKMDFTDASQVPVAFRIATPDIVVHAGAMSKPDECELDQAKAYKVNVGGTVNLLLNAANYKSHFIYLSTDFIFDGQKGMYTEEDLPNPVNYYGYTKFRAEDAVKEYVYDWAIVRTVFVYGKPIAGRESFITMIAKIIKTNQLFNVVNDQERTPTFAPDIADGMVSIIEKKATGIFNICGKDILTPYEMAMYVCRFVNVTTHQLGSITSDDLKEIAKRPLKSGLDISKAVSMLGYNPTGFYDGLRRTLG